MQPKEHDSGVPVPPAEDPPSVPTGWAAYAAAVRADPDAIARDGDAIYWRARLWVSALIAWAFLAIGTQYLMVKQGYVSQASSGAYMAALVVGSLTFGGAVRWLLNVARRSRDRAGLGRSWVIWLAALPLLVTVTVLLLRPV